MSLVPCFASLSTQKLTPSVQIYKKEVPLDLKRQRAETDRRLVTFVSLVLDKRLVTFVSLLRQNVWDICPNHSLPPAFLD